MQSASAEGPPSTPSLTGEILTGNSITTSRGSHCNADGTGYITFSVSGTAAPVYIGTFREWGVVAITKKNGLFYENFAAAFVINSITPKATIYGATEEPAQTFPPPPGYPCQAYGGPRGSGYSSYGNVPPNLYRATISRGGYQYRDNGATDVTFDDCSSPSVCASNFEERFTSSRGALLTPIANGR
jgi:hypothetical protein